MRINRTIVLLLSIILLLTFLVSAAVAQTPPVSEIEKYLVIAMADDDDLRPLQMSCAEIGADRRVLSLPLSPTWSQLQGCLPNLDNTFGDRWDSSTDPDRMNDASVLFQGIDWSGNIALTSDNSVFDSSNSLMFATLGVQSGRLSGTPRGSVSNTDYYTDSVQTPVPNPISLINGISIGHDFTDLLAELAAWKSYIGSLPADETITSLESPYDFTNNEASGGNGGLRTTFTNTNPISDTVIVVDFDLSGDLSMTNLDWVIDSAEGELIIFRILNGSNMSMQNTSILMRELDFGAGGSDLGAIFYHASEGSGSGDTVFTIGNNTVLNGLGLWDLNAIGEGGSTETNITINNGQGCAQFISQGVNFQNGRWVRCTGMSPTAITLGSQEVQSANGPSTAILFTGGLLLVASLLIVGNRIRRSQI